MNEELASRVSQTQQMFQEAKEQSEICYKETCSLRERLKPVLRQSIPTVNKTPSPTYPAGLEKEPYVEMAQKFLELRESFVQTRKEITDIIDRLEL